MNLRDALPNKNHKILARLPISDYWTTNYDKLIETALENENRLPDVKYEVNQFLRTVRGRDVIVYKMHGDIEHPDKVIITRRDFEQYHESHRQFINILYGDLTSKTFLFVGLSFTDPNLFYVLSRVRVQYEIQQREHFAIIKKFGLEDFDSQADFAYANIRQELFIKDLINYNITVFPVDKHEDLTEILRDVEIKYRRNTVFMSGSANVYNPMTIEDAAEIIEPVVEDQFKNKRKIINGYGLGFGDLVIGAAVRKIATTKFRNLQDYVSIRPFPQKTSDEENLAALWHIYREDMISRSGVAVFMFGNKIKDNELIEADEIYKEFEICRLNGVVVVPVGATGYVARKLWEKVNEDFPDYYGEATDDFHKSFDDLNIDGKPSEIAQRINAFIGKIQERKI